MIGINRRIEMNNVLKWIGAVLVVLVVVSNAFDGLYNYVYPYNTVAAILSGVLLVYVAKKEDDNAYILLNLTTTGVYALGLIGSYYDF